MKTDKYKKAIALIDQINSNDPSIETDNNKEYPKKLLYSHRMVDMLNHFAPDADEAQLLAARTQHICRWEIPRNSYPMDKKGYHAWRTFLYTYQADKATEVLVNSGYDQETIDRVKQMVSKKGIKTNSDTQLIEDVLCLVFIQHYIASFATKYHDDQEKLFDIIRKTWKKMSDKGHEVALQLPIDDELMKVLKTALS